MATKSLSMGLALLALNTMNPITVAALTNLIGFVMGIVLYAMLLVMVLRGEWHSAYALEPARIHSRLDSKHNWLLIATAILGLLWNVGALSALGAQQFGVSGPYTLVLAISFSALGFLPAVVVHSALQSVEWPHRNPGKLWIIVVAYSLSGVAALLHFYSALTRMDEPSMPALKVLTFGYLAIIVTLFFSTRREPGAKRAVWASALAVFAVSALHLSHDHDGSADEWFIELTGHHASLPLALAILYQDYRFAFVDIFLKRALSLLALMALIFGLYILIAAPFLQHSVASGQLETTAVGALLGLWAVTALAYPRLHRLIDHFVDKVILRRVDYGEVRGEIARTLLLRESPTEVLDDVGSKLAPALSATEVRWKQASVSTIEEPGNSLNGAAFAGPRAENRSSFDLPAEIVSEIAQGLNDASSHEDYVTLLDRSTGLSAVVFVPTAEPPYFALVLGALRGGRRLLSDDVTMLESVALMTARRIDALRVTHERCEQLQREQEIGKLATEAQLRALRAQINPHFLFNALTTIGYLIQAAPDRALETLMKLTSLLRGVLRTSGEFVTLRDELKLISSYLDIEHARFEERLRVRFDVPSDLLDLRIPPLLIQPLVENAVKHGIAPSKYGGEVVITAHLANGEPGEGNEVLNISVGDTGVGASEIAMVRGRRQGVGLSNVEQRLRCYAGEGASLDIKSAHGAGTTVCIRLPMASLGRLSSEISSTQIQNARERRGA